MKRRGSLWIFLAVLAGTASMLPRAEAQSCPQYSPRPGYITFYAASCAYYTGTPCALNQAITFNTNDTYFEACDSVSWDFGDGSVQSVAGSQTVSHSYSSAGTYTVRATASNSLGSNSVTRTVYAGNSYFFFSSTGSFLENSGLAAITVNRSNGNGAATVDYNTSDVTAKAGVRYVATNGTLSFADGETSKTFRVALINDSVFEGTQSFNVILSHATGVTVITNTTQNYQINDDDPPPTLSIDPSDAIASEADGVASVTVKRTGDMTMTVQASYSCYGSGTVGSTFGTLVFGPNEKSKSFQVPLVNDDVWTGDRFANLSLFSNSPAVVTYPVPLLRIIDDEPRPTLTIDDVSIAEGNSGNSTGTLTFHLSGKMTDFTVYVFPTSDAAQYGKDYTFPTGYMFFNGADASYTLPFTIIGNTVVEPDKAVQINLGSTGFSSITPFFGRNARVTILNDDYGVTPRTQNIGVGKDARVTLILGLGSATDETVSLKSLNPEIASVPASIHVPAGTRQVVFDAKGLANGNTTVEITLPPHLGGGRMTTGIGVYSSAAAVFTPTTLSMTAGTSQPVSISMDPPQTAPVVVALASNDPSTIDVPSTVTIPAGGAASFAVHALKAGGGSVTATLPSGFGSLMTTLNVDVDALSTSPKLSQVTPANGPSAGGTHVSIAGLNLTADCTVSFGPALATVWSSVSSTSMTATTPPHAPGSVDVTLTCGKETTVLANGFTYLADTPTLASAMPSLGNVKGQTLVKLTGTSLQSQCGISFGGSYAHIVSMDDGTEVVVATPPHAAGTVSVAANCPNGTVTLTNAFTYTTAAEPSASISSIDPLSGSAGESVTVTGNRFRLGDSIAFDAAPATILETSGEKHIVRVPELPLGKTSITLTDPDGHVTTTGPIFTILDPRKPEISTITPASGIAGDEVTLDGTGFRPGYTFTIDGFTAPVVSLGYSHVVIRVPSGPQPGSHPIDIMNASGQTSSIGPAFTVASHGIAITEITPACGPTTGGTDVTIEGTGFEDGATVTVGSVAASNVVVKDGQTIHCTIPVGVMGAARIVVTNANGDNASFTGFRYYSPLDPDGGCAPRKRPGPR